ncbi:hypothetical protein BGP77_16640 [Saccharospirillum sp. MSK14-1]|nr:hypothetical protein BGP77_16640 [Saccharospirillum sp. MSK14-1]
MAKGRKNRIQTPAANEGKNVQAKDPPDFDKRPPKFSLEKLQDGKFCFSSLSNECKRQFSEAMFVRRTMTWSEMRSAGRHGLGYEKISKSAIRAPIPPFITEEVSQLIAFRYNGKRAMVGYRIQDIFYVLWFDSKFKLYDHG